jgi:hypothetical protein
VAVGEAGAIVYCNYDNDDDAACPSWTAASSVPSTATLNDVVAGESKYVAVGNDGLILISFDGSRWAVRLNTGSTAQAQTCRFQDLRRPHHLVLTSRSAQCHRWVSNGRLWWRPERCGKSNIIDAVRWVLGESRPSELRGERCRT